VFGENVQTVREKFGERLAREAPVKADYVMPMPDSGRSAALGYARASGLPYREGIVPNRYVGRTFIKPSPEQRQAAVRLKLNIIPELVRDKTLVVVDDSIVRGTTTRAKMDQLRQAGAREIHLRISCPPIRHPCYFGVDFATRDQLIANGKTVEQIRQFLGVDSLAYLSLDGLLSCVNRPKADYCTACYSGDYRIDVVTSRRRNCGHESQLVRCCRNRNDRSCRYRNISGNHRRARRCRQHEQWIGWLILWTDRSSDHRNHHHDTIGTERQRTTPINQPHIQPRCTRRR
jgi:amidophosphoribosyltransferase